MFLRFGLANRLAFTVFAFVLLYCIHYYFYPSYSCTSGCGQGVSTHGYNQGKEGLLSSLLFDERQCQATFPLLTKEIDDTVAAGPFQFNRSVDGYLGQTHCRIKNGKLYIIATSDRMSQEMTHERDATLHQIQRALQTSPIPLPNIVFTISSLDTPREYIWSFSRPSTQSEGGKHWTMPHFSYWSWPKPFIGTIDQALTNIARVEGETPWEKKIAKAVWRGTVWFNSVTNANLRPKLLQVTKGKQWADVEETKWQDSGMGASNSIAIHDFCRYKYILYTEGVAYSGRLPFHQACESVILSPPPNFLLHNTHLVRPLFSTSLGLKSSPAYNEKKDIRDRWPKSYPASEANMVFVDPKWQDLEETVMYLESHPTIAKGIAKRQRETYVSGGYLSVASEVCYWISMIRGWSKVAKVSGQEWQDEHGGDGMRWETFSLKGSLDKNAV